MAKRGALAVLTLVLSFVFLFSGLVNAGTVSLDANVQASIAVIREMMDIPENAIPPWLFHQAHAIAIFPGLLKGGFLFAGSYGMGVVVERNAGGLWGNPVFFHLVGASFGFQAGVESTDAVLIFRSIRSVQKLYQGRITLGADASIAVGPDGRQVQADTDIQLRSEVLSYSKSKGLFGGVSFQGAILKMDYQDTVKFYNYPGVAPSDILHNSNLKVPRVAQRLDQVLDWYSTH